MKLVSTLSWSALATLIRLATGFVSIKFVSVLIGPLGVALVGQFGNFTQIIMTLAMGGISTGIIKFTSQYKDNSSEMYKVWHTAIWISGVMLLPIIISLLIFHKWLAISFLHNAEYGIVFILFALCLVFYVANGLILNILNGLHQIKQYNILNTLNSLLGLGVTIVLVYSYQLRGALIAIVVSQSITFFVIVSFVIRNNWFRYKSFFGKFDKHYFKLLMGFTTMSVVSMCVNPTSQMFVRGYLASQTSWNAAGCWQGMQKISDAYLSIVYVALGTYYLPKLANLDCANAIRQEIRNGYKLILPFIIISSVFIFIFRDFIIGLLFTHEFMPMRNLFFWQLLGDFFKISSWILAYLMLAKSKTKLFIITEITFGLSFPLFAYGFINLFGSSGAVMAFAVNYCLYLVLVIYLYKKNYLF